MRIKRLWLILGANNQKTLKLECLGCHREKKEFPGKVDKYRHTEQPLKVICFDGLFPNAQQLIRFWTKDTKLLNSAILRNNSKWNRNSCPWHASGARLQFQPQTSDYSASSVASQLSAYRRIAEVSSEASRFAQPSPNIGYFLKHEAGDFSGASTLCSLTH